MTDFNSTKFALAQELDACDELARFREEFVHAEPSLIYLDGNSLGRLPRRTSEFLQHAVEHGWGQRLIRLWNDGWINAPIQLAGKIARLIGAQPDEVIVTDSTSINLFKLVVAALKARPARTKIVSDVFNFPSDLYVFQGIIDLLGGRHRLVLTPSADTITIDPQAIMAAINHETALVSLTHVAFKSAFMHNMAAITSEAHEAGALVLWDLSHSTGAVPIDLNSVNADLAIGCTYKYLNGGPGAPAFLYVRKDLQDDLMQPIWGWMGAANPFDFDLDYRPAPDIRRFWVGTPPMLSLKAIEPAIDILLDAGMERLRAKSVRQTDYFIYLAEQWLMPLGFELGSPREATQRGSHVSLRHLEGFRINQALIHATPPAPTVIPDFRAPDNIRFGIAPLYNTFTEIHRALHRIRQIVTTREYEGFTRMRGVVT